MLSFVDESYQQTNVNGIYYTTYSAVCLSQAVSRAFSRDLCNLKRTLWKIDDPAEREMKGREILSERAIMLPKNREFVQQAQSLLRLHQVQVFAVVTRGPQGTLKTKGYLPRFFQLLLERVNQHTTEACPGDKATLVFDSVGSKTNRNTAVSVTTFLYRHGLGKSLDHVLDFPVFADSQTAPGLQIADLVAYTVNSWYAGRRGYLEDVFLGFLELTKDWHDRRGDGQTDYGIRFMDTAVTSLMPGPAERKTGNGGGKTAPLALPIR